MIRGMSEAHYDERSIVTSSDMEGSIVGAHGGAGNVYEVEHLATFQLSKDLAFPADGMRRLLHMEKNGFGIWSQKMKIRLEHRDIVILDYENGDEMERFPLQLIRDPTAFTNTNPGELYNNIFAFTVNPVEMHIFQCFNISAADLVEDVKLALQGRAPPNRQRHSSQQSLPPPPVQPPPEPPHFHVPPPKDEREDGSSVESEGGYEREVAILNRCFDDIERFIARLQFAAAAYRELQRRRKSKKSKKKDHGEGLLSMRARPPHEREFVDILQKFKLSFNLLARLKTHIHDPNAPELVHFLFTPLALIVDASRDAHAPGLASRVVAPLLSRGAIELLNNCLTSKETELWHSLGDAWLLPREQWKGYVPQYQPVFMDGWSPTIPDSNNLGAAVASEAQRRMQERIIQAQHEAEQRRVERERSISPVEIMPDDFASGQRAFVDSIRARGGRVVMVTHPRTANNHKELTVVRGEYLEVLDDSKKWWKACNWKGQVAHVPHTIVSLLSEYPQDQGYHADNNARSDNWSSPSTSISSDDEMFARKGSPPEPPPPVEVPVPVPVQESRSVTDSPKKKDKTKRTKEDEEVQLELRNVLTIFRERRKIEIPRTPDVYVTQDSTPTEVQQWLKAKGFSSRIQKQLSGMNGADLFKLKRAQIEEFCGKEEGRRLDSQITLSRNSSQYKTARSSELRSVLAKARAKAEGGEESVVTSPPPTSSKPSSPKKNYSEPPRRSYRGQESSEESEEESDSGSGSEDSIKSPPPPPPPPAKGSKSKKTASSAGSSKSPRKPESSPKRDRSSRHHQEDDDSDDAIVTRHFTFADGAESDDNDDDSFQGTLGRMLKQKQREMLNKKK